MTIRYGDQSKKKPNRVVRIAAMFGDQSAFAEAMGVNRSAISRWKQVGEIPHRHWEQLLRIARERKLPITFKDISGFNPSDL